MKQLYFSVEMQVSLALGCWREGQNPTRSNVIYSQTHRLNDIEYTEKLGTLTLNYSQQRPQTCKKGKGAGF